MRARGRGALVSWRSARCSQSSQPYASQDRSVSSRPCSHSRRWCGSSSAPGHDSAAPRVERDDEANRIDHLGFGDARDRGTRSRGLRAGAPAQSPRDRPAEKGDDRRARGGGRACVDRPSGVGDHAESQLDSSGNVPCPGLVEGKRTGRAHGHARGWEHRRQSGALDRAIQQPGHGRASGANGGGSARDDARR